MDAGVPGRVLAPLRFDDTSIGSECRAELVVGLGAQFISIA
jgi:hypothetical protein